MWIVGKDSPSDLSINSNGHEIVIRLSKHIIQMLHWMRKDVLLVDVGRGEEIDSIYLFWQ